MAIGRVVKPKPGDSPNKVIGALLAKVGVGTALSVGASLYNGWRNRKAAKKGQRQSAAQAAAAQREYEAGKKAYMDLEFENPYQNIENPYIGMVNPWASQENPWGQMQNPYAAVSNPFADGTAATTQGALTAQTNNYYRALQVANLM